jgi:hypothetical protein
MTTKWLLLIPALALLGCDVPPPDGDDEVLTDTVVTRKPDGTLEQVVTRVTRAERGAELSARSTGGVAVRRLALLRTDGDDTRLQKCTRPDDLWLYDARGNKLCIAPAVLSYNQHDSIDLAKVRYGLGCYDLACTSFPTWAGKVVRLWAGSNQGRIYDDSDALTVAFSAWEQTPVDAARSRSVHFYGPELH